MGEAGDSAARESQDIKETGTIGRWNGGMEHGGSS